MPVMIHFRSRREQGFLFERGQIFIQKSTHSCLLCFFILVLDSPHCLATDVIHEELRLSWHAYKHFVCCVNALRFACSHASTTTLCFLPENSTFVNIHQSGKDAV
jgi:hypothetical protein